MKINGRNYNFLKSLAKKDSDVEFLLISQVKHSKPLVATSQPHESVKSGTFLLETATYLLLTDVYILQGKILSHFDEDLLV